MSSGHQFTDAMNGNESNTITLTGASGTTTENGTWREAEIPLLVVGYDFRIASSAMREQLVTTAEERAHLFRNIRKSDSSAGMMVLETCNRLEWIVSCNVPDWVAGILEARMLSTWKKAFPDIEDLPPPYIYTRQGAVNHILRVVVGMESLAAGEAQIAGQFQGALKRAQKENTSSQIINRLGHIAGRIAKSGYKIGFRSNYRQGIHGLVCKFVENYFQQESKQETLQALKNKKILVAGLGEIGRRTAALLEETFNTEVQPFNRSAKPAHRGKCLSLTELKKHSADADVLVMATGGALPVLKKDLLDLESRDGEEQKLLLMDIGIPRQVSEELRNHEAVTYRNIDHLMHLSADEEKTAAMGQIEEEIEKEFQQFKRYCHSRRMSDLLTGIHNGRLELTENLIPDFVNSQLSDLDENRQKKIEAAIKQFIRDYSNRLFAAFHDTMENYWSSNGH